LINKREIYDADRHIIEPIQMWKDYVDPNIFNEYPITLKFDTNEARTERVSRLGKIADRIIPPVYMIGEQKTLFRWDEKIQLACLDGHNNKDQRKLAVSPLTMLKSMDDTSIKFAALLPTFATFLVNHEKIPAHVSLAYADGYNRWLKDYCQFDLTRFKPVGVISRHDPNFEDSNLSLEQSMVDQLETIISYGWTTITLRPEIMFGRVLGHPDYEKFWKICEIKNISVAIHGGTHAFLPTVGIDRFESNFAMHAVSHPMEVQMAFLSLLDSGVLERYPTLKFSFLEAGASWIPHWLWRLDNICYPQFKSLTKKNIKMLPSEYFKRQCWVAIEPGEPNLRETVKWIGHKRLLFGSDFPHPDHAHIDISNISSECSELTELELHDILENNPLDFFERPFHQS